MQRLPPRISELARQWRVRPLTEAEYEEFEAWYGQPVSEEVLWDTDDSSEEEVRARILAKVLHQVQKPVLRPQPARRPRYRTYWAAAATILLVLAAAFWLRPTGQRPVTPPVAFTTVKSTAGSIQKLILPDSSIVWLKGASELSYPRAFAVHERNVTLRGEALFEVTKNPRRPFRVRVGAYVTQVLGTSFNIKQAPDKTNFTLLVLTGKVRVLGGGTGQQTRQDVTAHHYFTTVPIAATSAPTPVALALAPRSVAQAVAGTEYDMQFEQTSFETIQARIEQKFNVRFVGYTGEYAGCKVTADLTDQSLEKSLRLLTAALNATYIVREGTIKLTGGGCF